ncbi:hypothetical protein M9H77_03758 [Catharanthus roseus]|uniref:Uncharacterized protein n=1 Tax=Catharanthus roseus TaxID=4058 RepID=A0ACC0CCB1_CATRO|nr:hypothetical protein M9H77_03758 [Catharanthus roseus]
MRRREVNAKIAVHNQQGLVVLEAWVLRSRPHTPTNPSISTFEDIERIFTCIYITLRISSHKHNDDTKAIGQDYKNYFIAKENKENKNEVRRKLNYMAILLKTGHRKTIVEHNFNR